MTLYKAAVIIPTRGGAAKLHFPLDALEQQTEKDFQVIVVCDGDIDGSAQVVKQYKERGILNIEAIVFEENQGRSKALNAGHQAADAHVLIRCDDDLEPNPNYVAEHVRLHQGDRETGVIGLVHNVYPENSYARAYGYFRDEKFRLDAYAADPNSYWHFWNANASLTQEMFHRLGGYDERYRLYGWEDVDMGVHDASSRGGNNSCPRAGVEAPYRGDYNSLACYPCLTFGRSSFPLRGKTRNRRTEESRPSRDLGDRRQRCCKTCYRKKY